MVHDVVEQNFVRKKKFLEHINNSDPHIQFTTEDAQRDGSIPFLYTIVMPQPDNSLLTPLKTEPRQPVQTTSYLRRKKITSTKHSEDAGIQHGF